MAQRAKNLTTFDFRDFSCYLLEECLCTFLEEVKPSLCLLTVSGISTKLENAFVTKLMIIIITL